MKDMIAERWMRGQFRLHLIACVLLVAVPFWPQLGIAAGAVWRCRRRCCGSICGQRCDGLPGTAAGFSD
jgi:hypothetical protein